MPPPQPTSPLSTRAWPHTCLKLSFSEPAPLLLPQTPEKDGLGLLPMPSLSSWMVPATTKPAAPREEPPRLPEGAMDEVRAAWWEAACPELLAARLLGSRHTTLAAAGC